MKFDQQENFLILKALFLDKELKHQESVETYKKLYNLTKNQEYLLEGLLIAYEKNLPSFVEIFKLGDKNLQNSVEFLKIKINHLVNINKLSQSLEVAKKIVALEKNSENYHILGSIQEYMGLNSSALQNYKISYEMDKNQDSLLKMAKMFLYKLNDEKSAIEILETHRRLNGCTQAICTVLADIYQQNKNYPSMIEIYQDLYEVTKKTVFLDYILEFYLYFKDTKRAKKILEKYNYQNKILIELYGYDNEFDKAIKKANESFKNTNDLEFLALEAMYLYEKNIPNISDNDLKEVVDKFSKSVPNLDMDIYDNFYGYVLIDHNIDINKGMEFVNKALLKQPNSPFYLDSLAWGYYKLNDCKKAYEVIKNINPNENNFFEHLDFKEHMNAINECLNKK
ncbi:tetratricopeptide repeat protein [Campylobacter portucalensis]|nr:hypothetical protein [Campylobacter portucalensis]